ncbi:MAG: phage replisome organizer N-terminal domain-containing protein [Pseudomonadota bacterium]
MKKEFTYDERWSWPGILLVCGDGPYSPFIAVTETMGYTDAQLADMIDMPLEVFLICKKKMIKHSKIEVLNNNIIKIINWKKYQPEYERQKEYRLNGKWIYDEENKRLTFIKLQDGVTDESTNESDDLDGDGDRDIEVEEEERKEKAQNPKTYDSLLPLWKKKNEVHFDMNLEKWIGITETYINALKEAFPALDIDFQLKKMKGWLLSNPKKAKSKRDWKKFIYNWLSNEKPGGQSTSMGYSSRKQQIRDRTAAAIQQEIREKERENGT